MEAKVLNREKLPDPEFKYRDEPDFVLVGELWQREDQRIEPRVLLALANSTIVETKSGIPCPAIALRQCEVLDLIRDLAHVYHQTLHKASESDPE